MTVYFHKPRARWVYHFIRDGKRYSGYGVDQNGVPVASRRAAREAEAVEKRKVAVEPKSGRASSITVAQIVAELTAKWEGQADWPNKQRYLREIVAYLSPTTLIADVNAARVEDYTSFALRQPVMVWVGGSKRSRYNPENNRFWKPSGRTRGPSTVNRYLPVLREIFARAHKLRDPVTNERAISEIPPIADLAEPKRKARPIPDGVLTKVIDILPQHVSEAVIASLMFGFRRSEIFQLQIKDVDFEMGGVRLNADEVKDDEDEFLPGAPEAMDYLGKLVEQAKARGAKHLITWQRRRKNPEDQAAEAWRPVQRPKAAWRTAMEQVEKAFGRRYRWHDIRAAFITHVALTSGPIAAQTLARHSDFRTTQGYIAVADEVRRNAAARGVQRPALAMLIGKSRMQESHTAEAAKPQKSSKSLCPF